MTKLDLTILVVGLTIGVANLFMTVFASPYAPLVQAINPVALVALSYVCWKD